ncbi:hypothetical protein PPTG_19218 [Phytophthora nicotianae INRA-310]|uniref:Uncharacterized protein n=1 Tax=Phytophthora nicotianae (strain INRA-310) TaxID=761204 RepID=W2PCW9_PHYN3|nr:hypothetical protein PPTG_19218 [Phytophthora nicotianae INRA-310]ETM98887.1 hypothetical protein PPTG_19218 [Phytophthora nicotianae INRA-310]
MAGSISEDALRNLRASPMREENGVAVGAVSRLALEREAPDDRQATGRVRSGLERDWGRLGHQREITGRRTPVWDSQLCVCSGSEWTRLAGV